MVDERFERYENNYNPHSYFIKIEAEQTEETKFLSVEANPPPRIQYVHSLNTNHTHI